MTTLLPEFQWEEGGDWGTYTIWIADNPEFDSPIVRFTHEPGYVHTEPLPENITFYWKVMPGDGHNGGEWSNVSIFHTAPTFFEREISWDFEGSEWTFNLMTLGFQYYAYRSITKYLDYASYVTPYDPVVIDYAGSLRGIADREGMTASERASFVLSFVQHFQYLQDPDTFLGDYPKYPVETVVEGGGDCEDLSILLASLLNAEPLGLGAVLLDTTGHMAVGILEEPGMDGYYFNHEGERYYYAETTATGWGIGEMPEDFVGEGFTIYSID